MFSSYFSKLFFRSGEAINIPSVKIHEIETAAEKPSCALKHLLKLNHVNHAILFNERRFHNHLPHVLSSAYLLGATTDDLNRIYDIDSRNLDPWSDSPGEISPHDWRDYLGKREYQRAYVDFFEDELVRKGYDWKAVVHRFLFSGKEPLISSITAGIGHPLIHLGYALEMGSRDVAMEALAMAAISYSDIHKYLDDPSYSHAEPSYKSVSPLEILEKVRKDKRFNGLFATSANQNLEILFREREAALLDHWNAWKIEDPIKQFRDSQHAAAAILVGTRTEKYDFFLVHILTTSHAVRIILPLIPTSFHLPLVRQWWLCTLSIYISQLRPEIQLSRITGYELKGRGWDWAVQKAIKGPHSTDAHYVKAIRALKEGAQTWGDADKFYLKAAVKFSDEFDGWDGFV
ncbi:Protein of unknown function (DUF4243) domain containing protein [Elaphomyces granulatus]|jgi:hypothetical protein|uniref:MGS207 protein n=1 Tax=Elaphomyces granulatus TaxID=519963 RepID=A0A232LSZ9_9EURO|nr:hypothetical protein Egran_05031 [Elaphomyces granulatus]